MGRGMERGHKRTKVDDENGFTLVELLIVIVILGIVAGAIATAFLVIGHSSKETTQRFNESHDAQIAAAYLANDVQSAQTITSTACGSGGTSVVGFRYEDASIATYSYETASGEAQVTRRFCPSGGSPEPTVVLVHYANGQPQVVCDVGNCADGSTPNVVKITIAEQTGGYQYSLSGARRSFLTGGTLIPGGYPPLLALGGDGLVLDVAGSGSLVVNGKIVVNSIGNNQNIAVDKGPNSALIATQGIEILQGGTCSGCTAIPRGLPLPDPLAGLPLPDESGMPVFTDGDPSHGPGVYRNTKLTFDSNTPKLQPGIYIVESGFSFQGSDANIEGDDVLLFNGCGRNAPGTCQNSGDFKLTSGNLKLTPPSAGSYAGLVFWQPSTNDAQINIGGGALASSITGLIYAPAASVTLSAGNAGLEIGSIIALSVNVTGTGDVTVG